MCLKSVIKMEILKEDLKAKKVVSIGNCDNILLSGFHHGLPIEEGLNVDDNKQILHDEMGYSYLSGFHCFSNDVPDEIIDIKYGVSLIECIIEITIPKGEMVVYGYQFDGVVSVVSKKIIIHRSKESVLNEITRRN